jgi:hypothetical protein
MFNLKFFISALLALTTVCKCHQYNCVPVICPINVADLKMTAAQNIFKYFESDGPEDGICLAGEKSIIYGSNYSPKLAGMKRCLCNVNETPNNPKPLPCPVQSSSSSSHEKVSFTQCSDLVPIGQTELVGDYYRRVGSQGESFTSDGCCPIGMDKLVLAPDLTGYKSNLCFCLVVKHFNTN